MDARLSVYRILVVFLPVVGLGGFLGDLIKADQYLGAAAALLRNSCLSFYIIWHRGWWL